MLLRLVLASTALSVVSSFMNRPPRLKARGQSLVSWNSEGPDVLEGDWLDNLSPEELRLLEQSAYESKMGLGPSNMGSKPLPMSSQTPLYSWRQDDDNLYVEIPLPHLIGRRDINMAIGKSAFSLSVRGIKQLREVAGTMYGEVDPTTVDFNVVEPDDNKLDPRISIRVAKTAAEGTSEMWYGFLYGEDLAPTVTYHWEQRESGQLIYRWRQTEGVFSLAISLPEGATSKDISVNLAPSGRSIDIEVRTATGVKKIGGPLWEAIRPTESTWFISRGDGSEGTVLEVELIKRSEMLEEAKVWWPCLLETEMEGRPMGAINAMGSVVDE